MGRDTSVNIVSMNSARRGMQVLSPTQQSSYLEKLIGGVHPDICFMPGDNGVDLGKNLVVGYEQYRTSSAKQAVLLYDYDRVTMNRPNVSYSTFGNLPGLDVDKLVTPMVEVFTQQPIRSVVKPFHMVSWQSDAFPSTIDRTGEIKVLESILMFSQKLATVTVTPIIIGGEIPLSYEEILAIVKKRSRDANVGFLQQASEDLKPMGFLPSMTNGSTTHIRHKFQMEVFRCSSNATWSDNVVSDCFIASKELQMTEAKMVDVEKVLGKSIKMEALKKYAPVQTGVKYENRPPRHHGG